MDERMIPFSLTTLATIPATLTSLPDTLPPIIEEHRDALLHWFSHVVWQRLLSRDGRHPLIRIASLLDFTALEQACAAYHDHTTARGRPVAHHVPRLLRAIFIKYWFDLSLRQLEERLRYDLLVRWFVGYGLHQETPDHTTLHRFEAYLYRQHPGLFFSHVLDQIDATVADGHERVQIADTFALRANAALESLLQRLRHSSYLLLQTWQEADPTAYAAVYPQLDPEALFGLKSEKRECYLSSDEWRQRLLLTVQAIEDCLALLPVADTCPAAVQRYRQQLDKIMADELTISRDADGRIAAVALLPESKRGHFRLCSATDPDATIRNHGDHKIDFGYNISVFATPDLIREIHADTGSTSDVTPIPDLLIAQAERGHTLPEKLIYDQIAGTGKTAHEVSQASHGRTQLVAHPMPPKKSRTLGPEDFSLSDDGYALTCPNGRISSRRYRSGDGDGWTFRFMPAQCLGCPLLKACRGKAEAPTTHRDVFISDYRADFDRLRAYSLTDDFKLDMKLRPEVERIIAGLVLHNGARYARFRGLPKVDFQVKMCAMIYNAKHWLVMLDERAGRRTRPKRRRWELPPVTQG